MDLSASSLLSLLSLSLALLGQGSDGRALSFFTFLSLFLDPSPPPEGAQGEREKPF